MNVTVKHMLPGRMRLRYRSSEISPRQALLAQTLIAVQEGIAAIHVNVKVHSFLVHYDPETLSKDEVLALFRVLSDKYLSDESLLASVAELSTRESVFDILVSTVFDVVVRSFLPLPIRNFLLYQRIVPRLFKAVGSLLQGKLFSTDLLDAAALTAAMLDGKTQTARFIAILLDMGEEIEELTRRQSYTNLAHTLLLSNEPVHLVEGGEERSIPPTALKKDDCIIVRAGSQIPADGDVEGGEGLVNQASITGEPLPVEKRCGSTVFAGTILLEGELTIRVRTVGTGTKVHNIIDMIDRSQSLKAAAQRRSELIAEKIVPFNFLLTGLTYLFTRNVSKTIATLMVDYSCAMKLAAPIAVLSAMKEAAERGISIKGGKYLEEAAQADTVMFDKTGTLTYAEPVLADVHPFGTFTKDETLRLAACLEEHFPHPLGRAVVRAADEQGLVHPERHAKVEYIVAHGIASSLEGKRVCIGSSHFIFEDEKVPTSKTVARIQKEAGKAGYSLLYLAVDGKLAGILTIGDPIREDAARIVSELRSLGVQHCCMITGDAEQAAAKIAALAGITEYHAQTLPEDKVKYVQDSRAEGHTVVMIGDGINDAPALSAAQVGIAMESSSSIAEDTADIILAEEGLSGILTVRKLGQGLLSRIDRHNKIIIGGNSLLLCAGMFGLIPPAIAAVLHNSLTLAISIQSMKPLLEDA